MKPDRWQQISRILQEALTRTDSEREAFLAEACAHDESLRSEVDSLLSFHASGDGFLETPGVGIGEPAASLTGRRLGVYQIQDLLGVGGMGEVYRAHDTKLERTSRSR
jgi:serine/threonine protein kinase